MLNPIKRLLHWGPISCLAITTSLTFATTCTRSHFLWIIVFQVTTCLCLYNMWCATFIGPGYSTSTRDNNSSRHLSTTLASPNNKTIENSSNPKVPNQKTTTRFCRRCDHIVLKKHHHCPWINNCVGLNNEQYFVRFLSFAIAVSMQSSLHLIMDLYDKQTMIILNLFNIGLSIGVLVPLCFLLYTH